MLSSISLSEPPANRIFGKSLLPQPSHLHDAADHLRQKGIVFYFQNMHSIRQNVSKGQISLPVSICERLSIDDGDKLVAYTSGDVIMLKTLKLPSAEEFEASLDEAQKWAKSKAVPSGSNRLNS